MKKLIFFGSAALAIISFAVYIWASFILSDRFLPEVSAFVETFYQLKEQKDFSRIYTEMTDPEFRKAVDQKGFEGYLDTMSRYFGKYKSKKRASISLSYDAKGDIVTAQYKTFSQDAVTLENFTFRKKNDKLALLGYKIVWSDRDMKKKPMLTPEDYGSMKKAIYDMIDQNLPQEVK